MLIPPESLSPVLVCAYLQQHAFTLVEPPSVK